MLFSTAQQQKNMTPKEKVTARVKRDHRILISLRMMEESSSKAYTSTRAPITSKKKGGKGEDEDWRGRLAALRTSGRERKGKAKSRGRSLFRGR